MKLAELTSSKKLLPISIVLLALALLALFAKWFRVSGIWIALIFVAVAAVIVLAAFWNRSLSRLDPEMRTILRAGQKRLTIGRLSNLPCVLVLGNKIIAKSGLNAEAIDGNDKADTKGGDDRVASLWAFEGTIFAELDSEVLSNPKKAYTLCASLRPSWFRSAFIRTRPAPRSCLIAVDLNEALATPASERLVLLNQFLQYVAKSIGGQLPVYILLDAFDESWSELSAQSKSGPTFATIPAKAIEGGQISIESTATKTLELLHHLALEAIARDDRRNRKEPEQSSIKSFLFVEHSLESENVEGIEDKGKAPAVRLADTLEKVSRRSQASNKNPFLRGVILADLSSPHPAKRGLREAITELLLKDQPVVEFQRISHQPGRLVPMMVSAGLAVLLLTFCLVSASRNRDLTNPFLWRASPDQAASPESLNNLDHQREQLQRIGDYNASGIPWLSRFGLYQGSRIYSDAHRIYFDNFRQLCLQSVQRRLANELIAESKKSLSDSGLNPAYDDLRTYLLITSEAARPERHQVTRPLLNAFLRDEKLSSASEAATVARQFDYYTKEAVETLPFKIPADVDVVKRARDHLCDVLSPTRLQTLEEDISRNQPGIRFRANPIVADNVTVEAAFTPAAWKSINRAIGNSSNAVIEPWVISSCAAGTEGRGLTDVYREQYKAKWRAFLGAASVLRFRTSAQAAQSLGALSQNTSPLFDLFCLASANTDVVDPGLLNTFQPVHQIAPQAACNEGKLITDSNREYMSSLGGLQAAMESVASNPNDLSVVQQARDYGTRALSVATQVSLNFRADDPASSHPVDRSVSELLKAPVQLSLVTIEGKCVSCPPPPAPAPPPPGKPKFCDQFKELSSKFPFAENSEEVSLKELQTFFGPEGALSRYFKAAETPVLVEKDGTVKSRPPSNVNSGFLNFLSQALQVQRIIYGNPPQPPPKLSFKLIPWLPPNFTMVELSIDGEDQKSTGDPMDFKWPGTGGAKLTLRGTSESREIFNRSGVWAVFRLIGSATWPESSRGNPTLRFAISPASSPVALLQLDAARAEFVFRPKFFPSLNCVSEP